MRRPDILPHNLLYITFTVNFLERIFEGLDRSASRVVLQEAHESGVVTSTGAQLRAQIETARAFVRQAKIAKGDRCALLAANSIRWIALDLALMAEGVIVVPLYARQAPNELAGMMRDAGVTLICAGDKALADGVKAAWPEAARIALFEEIFAGSANAQAGVKNPIAPLAASDPVTIIYTSGTSGEPKGVVLTVANLDHMLGCTGARLDLLMSGHAGTERVFHYLPMCFAGSWISVLSFLSRDSVLTLSMDLNKLQAEMKVADAHYFLNVPTLLERVRRGVEDNLAKRGGFFAKHFQRAEAAWMAQNATSTDGSSATAANSSAGFSSAVAKVLIFPSIRKKIGKNLKALICGSAPLSRETQLFFAMLGVPVLQVYGLTETTAICTMDDPRKVEPGWVGPAISGIEMKLGENDEIIVRGPNIFPGYWNRPEQTAATIRNGWFHSGDQGEVNASGNWRIVGRIKNLIILNSGHNIAPEPIEEKLLAAIPSAQQVVLLGNGKGYLVALVTGAVEREKVSAAIGVINAQMPHYKQIRAFHIEPNALTIESGLLTANGKLKRDAIAARYSSEIGAMYSVKTA
jgi:long-chain acyl-CoA synthetase